MTVRKQELRADGDGNGGFGPSVVGVVFQQAECMTVTNRKKVLRWSGKREGLRKNVRASVDQEPTSVSIRLKIKYVEPTCRYVRWEIQYQHDQLLGFRFSCIVFFFLHRKNIYVFLSWLECAAWSPTPGPSSLNWINPIQKYWHILHMLYMERMSDMLVIRHISSV